MINSSMTNVDIVKEINRLIDESEPLTQNEGFFKSKEYDELITDISQAFQVLNPRGWTLSPHRDRRHYFLTKTGPFEYVKHHFQDDEHHPLEKEEVVKLVNLSQSLDLQVATQGMEMNSIGIRLKQGLDRTEEDYDIRLEKLERAYITWTHEMINTQELLEVLYEVLNL